MSKPRAGVHQPLRLQRLVLFDPPTRDGMLVVPPNLPREADIQDG